MLLGSIECSSILHLGLTAELPRESLSAFLQSEQSEDHDQFQARCKKLQQTVFEFEMYQRRGRKMETLRVYCVDLFPDDVFPEKNTKEPNRTKTLDDQLQ